MMNGGCLPCGASSSGAIWRTFLFSIHYQFSRILFSTDVNDIERRSETKSLNVPVIGVQGGLSSLRWMKVPQRSIIHLNR